MAVKNKLNFFLSLLFVGALLLLAPQQSALSKQDGFAPMAPLSDGAGGGKFVLKTIRLEGNRLLKSSELDAVAAQFLNIEINYQDLLKLKANIEMHYARQNLAAVVLIPPQDMGEGVLTMELVESSLTDRELLRALSQINNNAVQVR